MGCNASSSVYDEFQELPRGSAISPDASTFSNHVHGGVRDCPVHWPGRRCPGYPLATPSLRPFSGIERLLEAELLSDVVKSFFPAYASRTIIRFALSEADGVRFVESVYQSSVVSVEMVGTYHTAFGC